MITPLYLDSINGWRGSKSHDFTIRLSPELELNKNKDCYVAVDSISMSYSWYNVSSTYGNNSFKYSHDGGVSWTTITLPNGNYTYNDIESYVQQVLSSNTHSKTGVEFRCVKQYYRVLVSLEQNYQLDLRDGEFADLIGFDKAVVTATSYGARLPNITRSVDNIFVHTNLISDSIVSGIHSDVICRFSVDNLPLSYQFHINSRRALYNKISLKNIRGVRIYITDAFNNPVDLNDIPVSLVLMRREE